MGILCADHHQSHINPLNSAKIFLLADHTPWFGERSGYEILAEYLARHCRVIVPKPGIAARLIGKAYSVATKAGGRVQKLAAAEFHLMMNLRRYPGSVAHLLYLENHLPYLAPLAKLAPIIGTVHQPPPRQDARKIKDLPSVRKGIILYQRDLKWFSNASGRDFHFIHHGVDTIYFRPEFRSDDSERVLCVGHHLRDIGMLAETLLELQRRRSGKLTIDFVASKHQREAGCLRDFPDLPGLTWHHGIPESQLRSLYQNASVVLQPMVDMGASSAFCSALACGCPIVATLVGGVADYGGGSVFPSVAAGDTRSFIEEADNLLLDNCKRRELANVCRAFAETTLAWPIVAEKHLQIYKQYIQ